MMIKSTNQVAQFYVANKITPVRYKTSNGKYGTSFKITYGNTEETTDFIEWGKVINWNVAAPDNESEILTRKALKVALSADVNGGAPVPGQDYVVCLRFRGDIGEEDTIEKVFEAHAKTGDTVATFLQRLAKSAIQNASTDYTPLYSVVKADGTEITEATLEADITDCFYLVEAYPYWRLGTFKETLAKIDVLTRPIIVNSDEEDKWLESYKFTAFTAATAAGKPVAIKNTHKVADMEYFYKGERGNSAFLNHPYDAQIPVELLVDPYYTNGYYILTIHYAYVGDNASNQKSEKDIIIVYENETVLTDDIKTLLDDMSC